MTANVLHTSAQHYDPARAAFTDIEAEIDGDSGELTVRLREIGGAVLFTQTLQPGRVGQ
jgi:alkaline phosphatase D